MVKFVDITKCRMNVEICGISMANHDQVKLAIQRNGLLKLSNGSRTKGSPIRSVIIRVITKSRFMLMKRHKKW